MAYETRTAPYYVLLKHCGPVRGVYLRWLSAPGGNWEGWLFEGEADTKYSLNDATAYSPADSANQVALQRPLQQVETLRAGNLTQAQHTALSSILSSPAVFIQGRSGTCTPVLVAENATAGRTTADGRHVLTLEVLLSPLNSLTN